MQLRTIQGFSRYSVSREGYVINNSNGQRLKPYSNKPKGKRGYLKVKLKSDNGTLVQLYVHRLVLDTFRPTDDRTLEGNHIDANIHNNSLNNLEWTTPKQNGAHKLLNRLFGFNAPPEEVFFSWE